MMMRIEVCPYTAFPSVHNINERSFLGQIDRDVVKKTHFGGFSDDEQDDDEDEVCISSFGRSLF